MRAYCPACGAGWTGEESCHTCGRDWWLNPATSVCGIVFADGSYLLLQRARSPFRGGWDFPGGFIEAHETAEVALEREMLEEAGLRIQKATYLGSWDDEYEDPSNVFERRATLNLYFAIEIVNMAQMVPSAEGALAWHSADNLPALAFPRSNYAAISAHTHFLQGSR